MSGQETPFYGKYRGVVTDNNDPQGLGRIKAKVLDVLGENDSGWALPALPYAGNGVGLFLIPPLNASVWIEFEHGEPDYPIWAGCFWAAGELPVTSATPEMKVFKTETATITINDLPGVGSVTIETSQGMKIAITATGIEIDDGQGGSITLTGPKVSINNDAFEVT